MLAENIYQLMSHKSPSGVNETSKIDRKLSKVQKYHDYDDLVHLRVLIQATKG